jgi:D-glycero-D-manno-heptose 1,7-bisphosphate phosphatase
MESKLKKAVFLDRDGVIIREHGDYTWQLEDVKINDHVAEALVRLQQEDYFLIVISNQGGIGKGLYTTKEADYIHFHISRVLGLSGIIIDEYYYCPHHPTSGKCLCRKPDSLLLEKAIARFHLNASECWFIGDTPRDMEAGEKAGVKTLKVEPNESLIRAVDLILSGKS